MSTSAFREQEFLVAYDEHADAIFRFCVAQIGDRDTARDLTQETFVRTWNYLARGKRVEKIRPFLYQTARNALVDHTRRNRTVSLDALREEGFDAIDHGAADPAMQAEASRAVALISGLSPEYREVVALRYLNDMSPSDIAPIVGLSENAVSVRIHRGLQKLRDLINP